MAGQLPSPPQRVVITTGNRANFLSWQQVVGVTNYVVQRSITGIAGSFSTIGSPTVPQYPDSAVTAGTQYWYQVASQNANGVSSYTTVTTNGAAITITPCLPGQINLGYLRYLSKLKSEKLNSGFMADDEWNFNLNQSANRLYDLLVTKYGDKYFLAPPLQFSTAGVSSYALPNGLNYSAAPALYKLAGVDVSVGGNQWFTLPAFNWIDRNKFATLQLSGTVQSPYGLAYCENGNQLFFIPQPTSGQLIQIWYIPMLTQMVLDTDMMPFSISGWSELVILDAAIKVLIKEESYEQAQSLIAERTALLERIEETAANRDVGQPNTVSNTRARAGDPNFGFFGGWGSNGFGNGWGG